MPALAAPPPASPLGLYLHIPFCRKRCHFCYFRVYTDKNAQEVEAYLDRARARMGAVRGASRPSPGGSSTSSTSAAARRRSCRRAARALVERLTAVTPWTRREEITFECEPGTLTEPKLEAIREMGVTRLSLGVENFDDQILELNGRAHRSPEIDRAYGFARALGFPQINIDLIAGMLGETDENWQRCVEKTLALEPDSVTIYQMELPFNTTISQRFLKGTRPVRASRSRAGPRSGAGCARRSRRSRRAGYHIGSAYTAVKDPARTQFVYRDRLWQGADLVGLGVASFGHVNGVHMQNVDTWETYSAALDRGELPLGRAYRPTAEERMIRELVLQLKRGRSVARPTSRRSTASTCSSGSTAPLAARCARDGYLAEATRRTHRAHARGALLRVDSCCTGSSCRSTSAFATPDTASPQRSRRPGVSRGPDLHE